MVAGYTVDPRAPPGVPASSSYAQLLALSRFADATLFVACTLDTLDCPVYAESHGFTTVPIRQGYQSLNAPMRKLMDLVVSGQLATNNNPVLRWMASNVMAETDAAGNIKPDKGESREKIDGISATITALARAMVVSITTHMWEATVW